MSYWLMCFIQHLRPLWYCHLLPPLDRGPKEDGKTLVVKVRQICGEVNDHGGSPAVEPICPDCIRHVEVFPGELAVWII